MRTKIPLAGLILIVLVSLLYPHVLFAREVSSSVNNFHPAVDDSRYVTAYGSQTLQQLRFKAGMFLNYANRPLIIDLGATAARRPEIVDKLGMADFMFSLGLFEWFQVGFDFPLIAYERYFDPGVASPAAENIYGKPGDLRFELKFRFLNIDRWNVGLALVPYMIAPTSYGAPLVGNNKFAGGGKLVIDFDIADVIQLALNAGYLTRYNDDISGVRQDDMFTYGGGISIKLAKWVHLIGEGYGASVVADFFDVDRMRELPIEAGGAFRFYPAETFSITVGGNAGLTIGYGTPDYRAYLGLAYTSPKSVELPMPPPPPSEEVFARLEEKRIVITRKIHFEFDKAKIRPVSYQILDAVVDILQGNPGIRRIQIEGHTDWIASNLYNKRLSQRRANAVRDYLVAKGVDRERLVARGFGEDRPLVTNETAVGRARNRRVEFNILERD